ncbi:MAG: tRNA (adenosine(37)-N6)-threonylcarbamoyltransferase complex dimerization subunit type 1 TsaB [Thermoguttaceae bacterium]
MSYCSISSICHSHAPRLIVLETTERFGSVALFCGDELAWSETLVPPQRSAQSLFPTIRRGFEAVAWSPREIDAVAVVAGPGSFTGLRIAVTAAKCLAYAAGAKVISVDSLSAIAAAFSWRDDDGNRVCQLDVAIDAQRGEAVVQQFAPPGDSSVAAPISQPRLVRIDSMIAAWHDYAATAKTRLAVAGTIFPKWSDAVIDTRVFVIDSPLPHAAAAGRVAFEKYSRGEFDDIWTLTPNYSRDPAAIEKAAENAAKKLVTV